ncbi:MAG TPA: acyl-CoA dehydrogenase family protein [Steroidobacteraceae bacterium]|jgi:acyl-CoA dehydrogenase|nr:acyl-CoA dehydrogenase family protein [Steroidobacteraceae bacterium]
MPQTAATPGFLNWPFFDKPHRELQAALRTWCAEASEAIAHDQGRAAVDETCRGLVKRLGAAGLTRYCVRAEHGGVFPDFDVRSICLVREALARFDGLADFAFAMQGLGSGAITLAGSGELQAMYLPRVARGDAIAAFALSESEAGSDVAAMQCRAQRDGDGYVLDGEKTWISNGGIADFYCVFARTQAPQVRSDGTTAAAGISAFVVDAATAGFSISERIDLIAPHPMATLAFRGCRIPASQLIGVEGDGFKIAMRTLDVFRTSVAAAAVGFAQRALDEAIGQAQSRRMFGRNLADFQLTQAALAEMATEVDAARLLTYRAAWLRDSGARVTMEAAMAKMTATETAQRVIDRALQLHGARGVTTGTPVERLYRDIRALRIYEGATEVQKLIIAREVLAGSAS